MLREHETPLKKLASILGTSTTNPNKEQDLIKFNDLAKLTIETKAGFALETNSPNEMKSKVWELIREDLAKLSKDEVPLIEFVHLKNALNYYSDNKQTAELTRAKILMFKRFVARVEDKKNTLSEIPGAKEGLKKKFDAVANTKEFFTRLALPFFDKVEKKLALVLHVIAGVNFNEFEKK